MPHGDANACDAGGLYWEAIFVDSAIAYGYFLLSYGIFLWRDGLTG